LAASGVFRSGRASSGASKRAEAETAQNAGVMPQTELSFSAYFVAAAFS